MRTGAEDVADGLAVEGQLVGDGETVACATGGNSCVEIAHRAEADHVTVEAALAQIGQRSDGVRGFGRVADPLQPHVAGLEKALLAAVEVLREARRERALSPGGIVVAELRFMGGKAQPFRLVAEERAPCRDVLLADIADAQNVMGGQGSRDLIGEHMIA